MTPEQIEIEIRHLATKEELHKEFADFQQQFGDFRTDLQKQFGDFRTDLQKQFADLLKTIWVTQLTTIGIVLVGVGLLIHFHL